MSNTKPLLEVKNLKMHFPIEEGVLIKRQVGAIRAVDGISFTVNSGETLGIVGESGCGKSTTARAIAQLYTPTDGEVLFEGKDLVTMSSKELLKTRKNIQMIFQDPYASLDSRMTVRTIIAEPLEIYSRTGIMKMTTEEIEQRVEELMERVGLSRFYKNRYPHEFSGGSVSVSGSPVHLRSTPRSSLPMSR